MPSIAKPQPKPPARKRPCSICRHWFTPNPRVRGRQRVCSDPECQHEAHLRAQRKWREAHPAKTKQERAILAVLGAHVGESLDTALQREVVAKAILSALAPKPK